MADIIIKNQPTTPVTPEAGETSIYIDSVTKKLRSVNDQGVTTDYASEGGLPEAPIDGKQYARQNAAWAEVNTSGLPYTPEDVANKENTTVNTSTTKYPTVNLLNTYVNQQRKLLNCGPVQTVSITNLNLGLVVVSEILANFNTQADFSGSIVQLTVPEYASFQLTENTYTYIVANYNAGSPTYQITTDNTIINHSTILNIAQVYWEKLGAIDELHIFDTGAYGLGLSNKIAHRLIHTERFGYQSGLALSEFGTRNVAITSGILWYDGQEIETLFVDSTVNPIHFYYHVAGEWAVSLTPTYNNSQYDNGTDLITLSNNKYTVNWVYKCVNSTDYCSYVVLGNNEYSQVEAQTAQPPAIPDVISKQAILVGRIIVLKNANTAQIQSAFDISFSGSPVVSHSDLSNLDYAASGHTGFAQETHASRHYPAGLDPVNASPFHGFENRTDSTLVWSNTAPDRTFTITGNFNYYFQSNKINVNNSPSLQITNTQGLWYIYFNNLGVLSASQSFPNFSTSVIIAAVTWNGSAGLLNDERHGYSRNLDWHRWAHNTVGARYGSGLDISNTGTGATATFSVSTGTIYDEDIVFSTVAPTTSTYLFKQTALNTFTFESTPVTTPFKWNAGTSRVQYINAAGPYTLADCAVNRYVNMWVYGTTCPSSPIWMLIETLPSATNGYSSVANARQAPPPSLSLAGLTPELKLLYRLVVSGDGIVQAAITTDDYRNASSLPSGGTASSTASSVSFAPSGNISGVTVQTAIEELDTEKQSVITIGTTAPATPVVGALWIDIS